VEHHVIQKFQTNPSKYIMMFRVLEKSSRFRRIRRALASTSQILFSAWTVLRLPCRGHSNPQHKRRLA
jgi:hypothetical protein